MRTLTALVLVPLLAATVAGCGRAQPPAKVKKDYDRALAPGQPALVEVDINTLPDLSFAPGERAAVRTALAQSAAFLDKKSAEAWFPRDKFSKDDVRRSVAALDGLLASPGSDADFNQAVKAGFRAFMSVGCDDQGTVLFTGYYTPIFNGSRTPDATYRYPLYRLPADLVKGANSYTPSQRKLADGTLVPYPAAAEIESSGMLKGEELVWLADPYECYLIRVQGSGKIRLPDGKLLEVGYAGTNGLTYHGIGQDLVADGTIAKDKLSFFSMREYFHQNPGKVADYTGRNPRFIFFKEVAGGPYGCIGARVTADVSIATDKDLFPPAGPVWVVTSTTDKPTYVGLRVDQDRGGAIRAPGRCDLYMGEDEANEKRAGGQYAEGKLYYLIAK
jgi:membrane-bound lytic murein transglycosylase A